MDAYGVYKEFSEVMKTTKYANLPDQEKQLELDGVTEVDLKHSDTEKEALLKNRMAVTAFTVAFGSCQDFYTMNIVIASKTKDWPSGKSWEIIKELQEEYAPTDLMGDAEQQKELESIRMHRHANPKELFSQITAIENTCIYILFTIGSSCNCIGSSSTSTQYCTLLVHPISE